MNTTQISLDTFKNILRKDVETLCREEGLNYDKETDRGYAFQKWCANLLIRRDGLSVDDVLTFASNDFKIDVVLEDADARRLYLIQSKYPSPASSPPVLEDEVITFFDRHDVLQKEPEYVRTHANDALLEYIADYSNRLEDGWLLYWYFITTGRASEKIADLCIAKDSAAKQEYSNVGFRLIDVSVLKELYTQSQTLEQSIPERTQFHLRKVRGTTLAGLYKKERERIFAYNIRSYLGKNQLNKEIIKTAISAREAFFYFNNGVSAICTSFSIDEQSGEFVGQNFQIINGAQTVGALSSISGLSSDVEILLRVTEAGSVKTEKGFNADIIRYNKQNIVKLSDFRSNDQIHLWLQNRFSSLRARGAVDAKIAYERKRSFRRVQKTYVISLEEFAKIRFGYLYEPTRCVADPKSLWTHQQDGGC